MADDPHGLAVLTASSASAGFERLASTEGGGDQRMPEISGTAFPGQVKGLYPDSARILLTGFAERTTVLEAVNRGLLCRIFRPPFAVPIESRPALAA